MKDNLLHRSLTTVITYVSMPFFYGFLFFLTIAICPACARAKNIRVLILNENYKSVPDIKASQKVKHINGKLLFQGIEYNGNIEIFKGDEGLFVINEVPLEEYVKGVVKEETRDDWPIEALKAQAVAVRTYAVYNMLHKQNDIFHLTSTQLSQTYKGANDDPLVAKAVNATKGEIITYNGEPINALYHSTSGGLTEAPEEVFGTSYPYLKSIKTECTSSPLYGWERRISKREMEKRLSLENIENIQILSRTKTGRAKKILIRCKNREEVLSSKRLRDLVGWKKLPSTWFSVVKKEDLFVFKGKGYGHGVGMCQWTSMEMALKGKNYKEILSTFYIDTVIRLYEDR